MKIRIKHVNAFNKAFANCTPGSVHDVLDRRSLRGMSGVWVMGVGEPVYILESEYQLLEEDD